MSTENSESNATPEDVNLDDFARDLFQLEKPEPVQEDAPVEESADDTSPSDADDTKPEANSEAAPEGEGEAIPEKPKKKSAAERISEVVAERNAERDRNAALQARLEALEAAAQAPKEETKTPAATNELVAPDPDERLEDGSLKYELGEYDAQYLADRVDYLFAKKEQEATAARAQSERDNEIVTARKELQTAWEAKLQEAEATEDMKDIREAGAVLVSELQDVVDPDTGDYLATTIMGMEQGPEVFYFLANNPDVARVIATQDAITATIALGALQERFRFQKEQAENGNPKPRVSKAPEPPKQVNRGSNGRFETPDDTEDLDAFARKLGIVNGKYDFRSR